MYVVPAALTSIFTAAGINNALESEVNGLIGFLDSHVGGKSFWRV